MHGRFNRPAGRLPARPQPLIGATRDDDGRKLTRACCRPAACPVPFRDGSSDGVQFDLPLTDIIGALRRGEVSASALIETAIQRHDSRGQNLNAYKLWDADRARAQAAAADDLLRIGRDLGALHGIPVSVKDLYGVPGYPTFAGAKHQLPERFESAGPVVQACLRQMAVVTGKTHSVEFAFGGVGTNGHWGTPKNPWSPAVHRVPGGSSAGAGVSLCEGSALVALGTDTAGSVRIPASATGNVGLKTTIGRWSTEGIVPLSPTLDTAGVMTRTVADAAVAFAAIDPDPGAREATLRGPLPLSDLRLAVPERPFWRDCSPGVAEATRGAIDEIVAGGAQLRSAMLPDLEPLQAMFEQGALTAVQLYHFLKNEIPDALDALDDNVRNRLTDAGQLPAAEYLDRRDRMATAARIANEALRDGTLLVSPTLAVTPPAVADLEAPDAYRSANLLMLRNTSIPSMLGLCAITIPVGRDAAGMPVGLQIAARGGDDGRLLRAALAVERALGTSRLGPLPSA